jgi:hypothetical protein
MGLYSSKILPGKQNVVKGCFDKQPKNTVIVQISATPAKQTNNTFIK